MSHEQSQDIQNANAAVSAAGYRKIPFEALYGITGALCVAAAIDRLTAATNKNTEALRDLRPKHIGPG